MGDGWAISATMLAGILVWGGVGLLLDRWVGTRPLFFMIGMIGGAAGAIYIVYLRYGRGDGGGT
jgi:F0F1-type ATP synthase assembly protein I